MSYYDWVSKRAADNDENLYIFMTKIDNPGEGPLSTSNSQPPTTITPRVDDIVYDHIADQEIHAGMSDKNVSTAAKDSERSGRLQPRSTVNVAVDFSREAQ